MNKYTFIAITIFCLIIGFLVSALRRAHNKIDSDQSVIAEKNDSIHYHKAKNGQIVAEKLAAEIKPKDLAKDYPEVAEQLKQLGIELKSVKAVMHETIAAKGSGNSTVTNNYYTDSAGVKHKAINLGVSDGYLTFKATVYDSLNAPYSYEYVDVITMAMHTKKKWLFGNYSLYGSGSLKNPNAKILSSTNVLIKDYKDKRWSIGPYVGYDVIRLKPTAGLSVQYSLIRF